MSKKDEEALILMATITINFFYIISGKEPAFKDYQENLKNLTEEVIDITFTVFHSKP